MNPNGHSNTGADNLQELVGIIIDGLKMDQNTLLSTGLVPTLFVEPGTSRAEFLTMGNGTELAAVRNNPHEQLQGRAHTMSVGDFISVRTENLSKWDKAIRFSSDVRRIDRAGFYFEKMVKALYESLLRSFEADVAVTLLESGWIENGEERSRFRLETFGYSNRPGNLRSINTLVSPWDSYLGRRSVVPDSVLLPAGFEVGGSIKSVGFSGGLRDVLIKKSSIAQRFVLSKGVEVKVYNITEDRMVDLKKETFSQVIKSDYDRYKEEKKSGRKRSLQPVSHVTAFYDANPMLVHPFESDPNYMKRANLSLDALKNKAKQFATLIINNEHLKDTHFADAQTVFKALSAGSRAPTPDQINELKALTPDGHLILVEEYLETETGKSILGVPFYEALIYFLNNPARLPDIVNSAGNPDKMTTGQLYNAKQFIDELVRVAYDQNLTHFFDLAYVHLTDRYPVQNAIIQSFIIPGQGMQTMYLERDQPGTLPTDQASDQYKEIFLSAARMNGQPLSEFVETVEIKNGVVKTEPVFEGRGPSVLSYVNNALKVLSLDKAEGGKNYSMMPFVLKGGETMPDPFRILDYTNGTLTAGPNRAIFNAPVTFPLGHEADETKKASQRYKKLVSDAFDAQDEYKKAKALFAMYLSNGFNSDLSFVSNEQFHKMTEDSATNIETNLEALYNYFMSIKHSAVQVSNAEKQQLIWKTFAAAYPLPRYLEHYTNEDAISLAHVDQLLKMVLEMYAQNPVDTTGDKTSKALYDIDKALPDKTNLFYWFTKLKQAVEEKRDKLEKPTSLETLRPFAMPLGAKIVDNQTAVHQAEQRFMGGAGAAAINEGMKKDEIYTLAGTFAGIKETLNILLFAADRENRVVDTDRYNLLVLQPNIEFEMASGVLFRSGPMTATFVRTSRITAMKDETVTGDLLKLAGEGKTVVTDPRGIASMEDIKFTKYCAGGGTEPALSEEAVFKPDRKGQDLLVIPVPTDYVPHYQYTELNYGSRGVVRHYQGLQINFAGIPKKFSKIVECKGHLREGASLPGARSVMDGFKQQFDPVDYANIVKQLD